MLQRGIGIQCDPIQPLVGGDVQRLVVCAEGHVDGWFCDWNGRDQLTGGFKDPDLVEPRGIEPALMIDTHAVTAGARTVVEPGEHAFVLNPARRLDVVGIDVVCLAIRDLEDRFVRREDDAVGAYEIRIETK